MAKITDPDDLTYSVNGATGILRFNTTDKTIELVEGGAFTFFDGVTGQCLFSKYKEVLRADPNLNKYALPIREMIHDESIELINGWTFKNTNTLKAIRDCGVAYRNVAGVLTAMFACFVSLGPVAAGTSASDMYLVQSSATNATTTSFTHLHTDDTFGINELVQIYSDTNGDGTPDYDLRSYAKLFLRRAGYTYDEATNEEIGYPSLTYKKYNFPLTHGVDAGVTVDDATLATYTGMTITWYASAQSRSLGTNGPYNAKVIPVANGRTYQETYSWIQYQLRQNTDIDAGAGNRVGKVTPALVYMDGSTLKTIYQPGVGGVFIDNIAAASYNNVAYIDDTQTYRTYPYTAAVTFEFDEYLQADAGVAKFWIYDAATYPGAGATLLQDASGNPMSGTISGPTASFSFAWTVNKNWIGIAAGDDDGKIAVATGTIEQSTGNKGVFVAGQERWKI
jgi:hypothetical protein